jgi:hypothetical protein
VSADDNITMLAAMHGAFGRGGARVIDALTETSTGPRTRAGVGPVCNSGSAVGAASC